VPCGSGPRALPLCGLEGRRPRPAQVPGAFLSEAGRVGAHTRLTRLRGPAHLLLGQGCSVDRHGRPVVQGLVGPFVVEEGEVYELSWPIPMQRPEATATALVRDAVRSTGNPKKVSVLFDVEECGEIEGIVWRQPRNLAGSASSRRSDATACQAA